ncbi:AAA family ATPase [Aquincola sp. S2]|uniref:AAA family ATPase n=1 Tax=Pseudaquabacterium terrae TaxID=2732868 RepID=A0ABX2EKB1_9BURK|nr:AAA family ATPase [Aquabacterium terrae]NRF69031.1 AAA family ATPase [Aquabacterium terrae]
MSGKIVLLNGPSSSGKSTLARAVQARIGEPFWHYSIDHLLAAGILPRSRIDNGEFPWPTLRPQFFDGFHRSIAALADGGNNLIVEHIVETRDWMTRLLLLLEHHDVFFVGIHCPLVELERRERERGDRRIGEARADFEVTHTFGIYDFQIDGTAPSDSTAAAVIDAWQRRTSPSAFVRMREGLRRAAT